LPSKQDKDDAIASGHSIPNAAPAESFATRVSQWRWSIVAGVCLLAAGACLLVERMEAAFVAGTLGLLAWFWNERNRLSPASIEADEKFQDEEIEERDEE
jgi:hypothetical protein